MCIKHINLVIKKSNDSTMDNLSLKSKKLFCLEDESSDSNENFAHPKSNENENQANILSNDSFCQYCLTKQNAFQIEFDQSIRLCTNIDCSRYKNINLFSIEVFNRNYRKLSKCDDQSNGNICLDTIVSNLTDIAYKIVQNGFDRYENAKVQSTTDSEKKDTYDDLFQSNYDTSNFNNPSMTFGSFEQTVNSANNQSSDIPEISHFDSVNFNTPLEPSNNVFLPTSNLQPQQSILFDENFFTDIDNFLTEDYKDDNTTASNQPINTENPDWILTDKHINNDQHSNPNNLLTSFEEPSQTILEPLLPTNTSKLASQLASGMYSNEFLEPVILIDSIPVQLPDINENIVAETKSGNSGILITKQRKSTKNDSTMTSNKKTNQLEVSISSTKLKIVEEKDELFELIAKSSQKSQSKLINNKQPVKTYIEEFKPSSFKTAEKIDKLLPWEIKSKEFKKKTKPFELDDSSSKNNSSPSMKKQDGISPISRIQSSVTKADLSQKNKEAFNSLKEKGAELKKALLESQPFLAGITINKSDNTNKPISSGGYKDLVLSVLKKKTQAPV